ncbi:phytoene/squalene synthase family protein [Rhizobacter sp. OV335]|uniref:phytoene/squalene synthase family protein n=1 Tax=Rhizobacter sp. OV335 TaxID=1500264 RepID=UPI000918A6D2|nr:phytoene/squalene synthase family protein [Rhizobacter sp. OV335]SHN20398.1 farnesyl-diphosphate farnesyltransferase [Rhizobacter sp. OV335]
MPVPADTLLGALLKRVSRSFYLSLRMLPPGLRAPVSLAYLLARAADTIADTPGRPAPQRLAQLQSWREQVAGTRPAQPIDAGNPTDAGEAALMTALPEALDLLRQQAPVDTADIRRVVTTLTDGMCFDLQHFEHGRAGAPVPLQTRAELDRYTYMVAGCVGEFWTDIAMRHRPELQAWPRDAMVAKGIAYGQALQLTNVLRDAAEDLANGRCYLPAELLAQRGLTVADLSDPSRRAAARPLLVELSAQALAGYRDGADYVLRIPAGSLRLRLASLWPLMLGLASLELLLTSPGWLEPSRRVKVTRGAVYRMLLRSVPTALSTAALRRWIDAALARTDAACRA